jgi:hypothetical protein
MLKWIIAKLSMKTQKELILFMLGNVLKSKTASISNAEAQIIVEMVVKSVGNNVVSFIVKD